MQYVAPVFHSLSIPELPQKHQRKSKIPSCLSGYQAMRLMAEKEAEKEEHG
jgi:hypothetical protein